MTIGLIALRAAKEQLAAAIETIKDELKNPDLAEQIKFDVYNIGSDLDDHLTELGNAMPAMFAAKATRAAGGLTLLDPTQGHGTVEGLTVAPDTAGNPALEPGVDIKLPNAPSAEDLDSFAEEQKAAAATDADPLPNAPEIQAAGEGYKSRMQQIEDAVGNAIGEAKFGE